MTSRTEDGDRLAMREQYGMLDLGRMPSKARKVAYSWGGTVQSGIMLYQVASCNGLTADLPRLRAEVAAIDDAKDRAVLVAWLDTVELEGLGNSEQGKQ